MARDVENLFFEEKSFSPEIYFSFHMKEFGKIL
jgi:hypothetical protein